MDTKQIGLWSFYLGVVLALITAFVSLGNWAGQVIIVLGILAGVFHNQKSRKYLTMLGLSVLVLLVTASAADGLIFLGAIITPLATAYAEFLGVVALTAYLLWGAPMLLGSKKK